jgi:hypothetical protein
MDVCEELAPHTAAMVADGLQAATKSLSSKTDSSTNPTNGAKE